MWKSSCNIDVARCRSQKNAKSRFQSGRSIDFRRIYMYLCGSTWFKWIYIIYIDFYALHGFTCVWISFADLQFSERKSHIARWGLTSKKKMFVVVGSCRNRTTHVISLPSLHHQVHEATALLLETSPFARPMFEGWDELYTINDCVYKDLLICRPCFLGIWLKSLWHTPRYTIPESKCSKCHPTSYQFAD